MVVEITGLEIKEGELEQLVARVFFKSIDLLGGLNQLAKYRTLTWLPSLARAAFAVVLREEYIKTEEEIAATIGLSKNTVRNILRAEPQAALYKIQHLDELSEEEKKELKVHTAGGLAKLAYKLVKDGQDAQVLMEFCTSTGAAVAQLCDIPWAYLVLKRSKGIRYPITSPEELKQRLAGIEIKGVAAEVIVDGLSYPIKSPAMLLHEIKEYLQSKGLYDM